ncbi:ABC transporter permease [Aeromicrobium sp. YIM 150415]|uniref:ABC transporter permease n=1 Tax=Aeromicrobium sp. YIM 150415 TaxID=2803912 RepID=UPI001962978C|nr:ABC transporter permease [Aeromicrobium sp. YIM 150415]MBM9463219.1 ABC transporter permease [Aeromicrobium sp. YIM 150415]
MRTSGEGTLSERSEPSDVGDGDTVEPTLVVARGSRERRRDAWHAVKRFFADPMAFVAGLVILLLVIAAALGPWIAPYDPAATDAAASLQGPSGAHWLGTDQLGRDIFSRILAGARLTLFVSVGAVSLAVLVGCTVGLVAGFVRGWSDSVLMRLMDILLAFPGLILAIVMAALLGPGITTVIIAVGVSGTPTFARVTRAATMRAAVEEYVLAARAIGCSRTRLLLRHITPNILGPVVVLATLYLAYAVLTAAALSFLGVGVKPPAAEWGAMVNEGRDLLAVGWWVSLFPGVAIVLFVLAVNILGDRLRDVLDVASGADEVQGAEK